MASVTPSAARQGDAAPVTGARPTTEQAWVVHAVAERMWTLARLTAREPLVPPPPIAVRTLAASPGKFEITIAGAAPVTVRVVEHLWDPRTFAPLVEPLGLSVGTPAKARAGDRADDLPTRLLSPTLDVLLAENQRVSDTLRTTASADAHEQAALLLGALALREAGGPFSDIRPALNRMAAHLAVAGAWRGTSAPSLSGVIARAVLLTVVGREVDALAAVQPLTSVSPTAAAWARALATRATGDWRRLPRADRASLLERSEFGRALRARIGDHRLLGWLEATNQDPTALFWTRPLLTNGFSVEAGSLAAYALVGELAEASVLAGAFAGVAPADQPGVLRAMATAGAPVDAAAFRVLDWPLLAGAAERHVVASARSVYDHESNLARAAKLRALPATLEKQLGGLPLLPLALAFMHEDAALQRRALASAVTLLRAQPERVPPAIWTWLARDGARQLRAAWPSPDVWFTPWQPDGTVMAAGDRSLRTNASPPASVPELRRLHALAPSNSWASWLLAWNGSMEAPPLAVARDIAGAVLEYDAVAILRMFRIRSATPADTVALATSLCELDGDQCFVLASELLRDGRDVEAADEYRRWATRSRSRVTVSNQMQWLVRYLLDEGNAVLAEQLAKDAADVGSGTGMATHAEFLERRGDLAGAEQIFERIRARYDISAWPLGAYHLRQWKRTGDTFARDRGMALVADRFPSGLEPAPTDGAAPVDGVAFTTFGRRAERAGLRASDILVGIDGYRVRSDRQLAVVIRLALSNEMTFTVWRDGGYVTFPATLPQRWLGVATADYRRPQGTVP